MLILEADEQQSTDDTNTQESDFVKDFSRLKNFTLWFIPVSKSAESAKTNLLNKFKDDNNIDATLKNCFYKDVSKGSFNDIITSLQKILNETNMKMDGTYSGFFALCTGDYQNIEDAKNRTIDYYDKNLVLLDNVQYQEAQAKQKADEQQKFNDTQNKLFGMGLDIIKNLIDNFEEDPVEALDNIKKTYPQKYNNYPIFNSLTTNANDNSDVITKRAKEFMKSGQLQRDIINLILDVTNQRKEFNKIKDEDKNSWDKFVKACSNLPMFKN